MCLDLAGSFPSRFYKSFVLQFTSFSEYFFIGRNAINFSVFILFVFFTYPGQES